MSRIHVDPELIRERCELRHLVFKSAPDAPYDHGIYNDELSQCLAYAYDPEPEVVGDEVGTRLEYYISEFYWVGHPGTSPFYPPKRLTIADIVANPGEGWKVETGSLRLFVNEVFIVAASEVGGMGGLCLQLSTRKDKRPTATTVAKATKALNELCARLGEVRV